MSVLFVCTGNICRSPTAEAVLRHRLQVEGLGGYVVESAGLMGYHVGQPPDRRSIAHARRRGYDLTAQRARRFVDADYHRFDRVLAMDRGHLSALVRRAPDDARDRIGLFLDLIAGPTGRDVPDPYYDGAEAFEQVLDLIEAGVDALVAEVRATPDRR